MGGYSSVLNGGNFWDGATNGALWGGAQGGASGLMQRLSIKSQKATIRVGIDDNGKRFHSTEEINSYTDNNIGDHNTINAKLKTTVQLASNSNLPDGATVDANGVIHNNGSTAAAVTKATGGWFSSLKSNIYIGAIARGLESNGVSMTTMIINHEYLHAAHVSFRLTGRSQFSERATSNYSATFMRQNMGLSIFDYTNDTYRNFVDVGSRSYPYSYDWRRLAELGILNMGIK